MGNFGWIDKEDHIFLDQESWNLLVLTHWNNNRHVNMSFHSDTLSWFKASQPLLLVLNDACLAENRSILILLSLVWPDRSSNPKSTAFEASTSSITPLMRIKVGLKHSILPKYLYIYIYKNTKSKWIRIKINSFSHKIHLR